MVIRTFCHPETVNPMIYGGTVWLSASFINQEANEPVDAQRLMSPPAPFVNQEGSELVDTQRLTSSSTPFVILRQQV